MSAIPSVPELLQVGAAAPAQARVIQPPPRTREPSSA